VKSWRARPCRVARPPRQTAALLSRRRRRLGAAALSAAEVGRRSCRLVELPQGRRASALGYAHDLVYDICREAVRQNRPLLDLLKCLVLTEAASNAIIASPDYEDDERPPLRPRLKSLADEMRTMLTRVAQLPLAVTLEGLRAMSQAALALAPKDDDGAVDFGVDSVEHLAFTVIRAMAGLEICCLEHSPNRCWRCCGWLGSGNAECLHAIMPAAVSPAGTQVRDGRGLGHGAPAWPPRRAKHRGFPCSSALSARSLRRVDEVSMSTAEYSRKLNELDRLVNDPDVPIQPGRIWSLLADVSRTRPRDACGSVRKSATWDR
jgi:hypothetical protein